MCSSDLREHCGRWSSDGEWIVYESDQSGNNDIWVVPSDGEESTQVTFDDYEDGYPAWSPDGTHIVYNSLRGINGDLHILSLADGVLHCKAGRKRIEHLVLHSSKVLTSYAPLVVVPLR